MAILYYVFSLSNFFVFLTNFKIKIDWLDLFI